MLSAHRVRRLASGTLLVVGGFGASATALLFAIHPAAAASAFAAVASAVSCAVTGTNSCVSGTNTSSGIGVLGSSNSGTGVRGSANSNYGIKGSSGSSYGMFGTSTSGFAGVAGTSSQNGVYGYTLATSGGIGVHGTSAGANGFGVVGLDTTSGGTGVYGIAAKGDGIEGDASDGGSGVYANVTGSATGVVVSAKTGNGINVKTAGEFGVVATSTSSGGFAVYGLDNTSGGVGVLGEAEAGSSVGVEGAATAGVGVNGIAGQGGIAVHGVTDSDASGNAIKADAYGGATGVWVNTDVGTGVYVQSGNGPGIISTSATQGGYFSGTNNGVIAHSTAGTPLAATSQFGTVFSVDEYGNVSYSGGLTADSQTAGGATVRAFSPKTTAPTVEDTGTAQLVAGSAAVRLDPTFAATIDPTTPYRVFVTPDGDMGHALFVAMKTTTGFIVREMQGGRSTVSFDYRVVATALGKSGQRIAITSARARIPAPATPAVKVRAVKFTVPTPPPFPK